MGRRVHTIGCLRLALAALLLWTPVGAAICEAQCLMADASTIFVPASSPTQATGHCDHATRESAAPDQSSGEGLACYCNAADWAAEWRHSNAPINVEYDLPPTVHPHVGPVGDWTSTFRAGAPPGRHSPFRYLHRPLLI